MQDKRYLFMVSLSSNKSHPKIQVKEMFMTFKVARTVDKVLEWSISRRVYKMLLRMHMNVDLNRSLGNRNLSFHSFVQFCTVYRHTICVVVVLLWSSVVCRFRLYCGCQFSQTEHFVLERSSPSGILISALFLIVWHFCIDKSVWSWHFLFALIGDSCAKCKCWVDWFIEYLFFISFVNLLHVIVVVIIFSGEIQWFAWCYQCWWLSSQPSLLRIQPWALIVMYTISKMLQNC